MKKGFDGARDHHGDLLPELSASATRMKYDKLIDAPLPTFDKNYPGSPFFTELGYFMLRRTMYSQFRTFETTGADNVPTDRGSMCSAWHTNGLMDPIAIFLTHPKKFVVGGRHDLVTRPILGFWARKFAVQPVVRKAELLRGGCSEEEANYLNGRSLLNLATGISHGFGCALFPEGTSHSESHLIRLKTGPFRTVLAAAAHAKANGRKIPTLIPIG
ncbi:MAG: 1-acyl-sn-glycerol-3-phosphate acyltransferase, partial [Candidatus Poseidoniaceae archaeon]